MGWRAPLEKMIAATVFALAGATLAAFVWPQMHRSDLLLRDGVSAKATVVALDGHTSVHANSRVNREYPCFRVTGEWTHAGVSYRTVLGYYTQRNEAPLGTTVPIIFAPIRRLRQARSICRSASSAPGGAFLVRSGQVLVHQARRQSAAWQREPMGLGHVRLLLAGDREGR